MVSKESSLGDPRGRSGTADWLAADVIFAEKLAESETSGWLAAGAVSTEQTASPFSRGSAELIAVTSQHLTIVPPGLPQGF